MKGDNRIFVMGQLSVGRAARPLPAICGPCAGPPRPPCAAARHRPTWPLARDAAPPPATCAGPRSGRGAAAPRTFSAARAPAGPQLAQEAAVAADVQRLTVAHRPGTDDDSVRAGAQSASPADARVQTGAGTAGTAGTGVRAAARPAAAVADGRPGVVPNGRHGHASARHRAATHAAARPAPAADSPSGLAPSCSELRPSSSSRRARHSHMPVAGPGIRPGEPAAPHRR